MADFKDSGVRPAPEAGGAIGEVEEKTGASAAAIAEAAGAKDVGIEAGASNTVVPFSPSRALATVSDFITEGMKSGEPERVQAGLEQLVVSQRPDAHDMVANLFEQAHANFTEDRSENNTAILNSFLQILGASEVMYRPDSIGFRRIHRTLDALDEAGYKHASLENLLKHCQYQEFLQADDDAKVLMPMLAKPKEAGDISTAVYGIFHDSDEAEWPEAKKGMLVQAAFSIAIAKARANPEESIAIMDAMLTEMQRSDDKNISPDIFQAWVISMAGSLTEENLPQVLALAFRNGMHQYASGILSDIWENDLNLDPSDLWEQVKGLLKSGEHHKSLAAVDDEAAKQSKLSEKMKACVLQSSKILKADEATQRAYFAGMSDKQKSDWVSAAITLRDFGPLRFFHEMAPDKPLFIDKLNIGSPLMAMAKVNLPQRPVPPEEERVEEMGADTPAMIEYKEKRDRYNAIRRRQERAIDRAIENTTSLSTFLVQDQFGNNILHLVAADAASVGADKVTRVRARADELEEESAREGRSAWGRFKMWVSDLTAADNVSGVSEELYQLYNSENTWGYKPAHVAIIAQDLGDVELLCSNSPTDLTDARRFPFFNAFPHAPLSEAIADSSTRYTQMLFGLTSVAVASGVAGGIHGHYFPSDGVTAAHSIVMALSGLAAGIYTLDGLEPDVGGGQGHATRGPVGNWFYGAAKKLADTRAELWNRLGPSQVTRDLAMTSTDPFIRDYLLERLNG